MTDQDAGWLTIREAARLLNMSELTIRRRIKDGKLPHRWENGKYVVLLTGDHPTSSPAAPKADEPSKRHEPSRPAPGPDRVPAVPAVKPAAPDLAAILPEFGRLAERAGQAAALAEQVRALQERCSDLERGTVALATRNGWLESKLEEREQKIKLLTDSRPRRSWWRRLFMTSE